MVCIISKFLNKREKTMRRHREERRERERNERERVCVSRWSA